MNLMRALLVLFFAMNMVTLTFADLTGLSSQLCAVVTDVRDIVGVFALVLFLIGGVLYAAAHFMPAAGQIRGNLQGWAMGMIIGGVIGLILVIMAPYVVTTIAGFGNSAVTIGTSCP